MAKNVFSHKLQKDVLLDGEALDFYEAFTGKHSHYYRQGLDAADYLTLVNLGYTLANDRELFSEHGRRVMSYHLTRNSIRPEVAYFASRFLEDRGNSVQEGTWFAEALAALDATKFDVFEDLMRAGWSNQHAIIIAAFPQREARLKEAIDNDMEYYDVFFGTTYDLAMCRRLLETPGAYFLTLKKILDKGFTEAEIKGFGYNATEFYDVADLRAVTIKPSFFKNIVSAFPLRDWKPSVAEVEGLFAVGIKNSKQYKAFAKMLGMKVAEPKTMEAVRVAAKMLPFDEASKVYAKTGTLSLPEIGQIGLLLADGHTVDQYLALVDAVDSETESDFSLGVSMATSARSVLAKGLTAVEIKDLSQQGISLAEM
jgi:hypothetical protein